MNAVHQADSSRPEIRANTAIVFCRLLRNRGALALALLLVAPMSALCCEKWDITGTWHIKQANGFSVALALREHGGEYDGYAPSELNHRRQAVVTDVMLHGDFLSMTLLWGPDDTNATDATGVYTGRISSDGRISGATYDRDHPQSTTTWSRINPLRCLDSDAPRPIHRLGKLQPFAPTDSVTAAESRSTVSSGRSDSCISGFVWREARPTDHVCVTPQSRTRVARENASSESRVDGNGPYGPASCKTGFVWREAFEGDVVCVTPEVRNHVKQENRLAGTRVNSR